MISEKFLQMGEYGASGMYEEPQRSLFYRKALGIRRYYEHCALGEYTGKPLYPSGILPLNMKIFPYYFTGMNFSYQEIAEYDVELADALQNDFGKWSTSVPVEHSVGGNMWTHCIPNYERILQEGLLSYIPRIEKIEDKDMREGLLHVVAGLKAYVERCVSYLENVCAEEKLIRALKKVPLYPAENIYEAIVCWNFILYLDWCDNLGCVESGLYPYYHGEDVTEWLKNLYDNLDENCGYSMALSSPYTPLTLQCLEASKGKRRPMIELLVNEEMPQEIWDKALELVKSGNGQPAFYNEKILQKGLLSKFPNITERDWKKFCGCGCTESMIAGLSCVGALDAGINLLLLLEQAIYGYLAKAKNFEDFYRFYVQLVRETVENVAKEVSESQFLRAKYNPLPMRTLLVDDCIDNGVEFNGGGARYKWRIVNFAGMINTIDSLLVIRDFVFEKRTYAPDAFISCLQREDETFLQNAKKYEIAFGKDNPDANAFSKRFSGDVFATLEGKKTKLGEDFIPASIQFMSQAEAGRKIGATPDGRKSGTPLCDSLAAIFGKDTEGPTALLRSVTSLQLDKVLGTPVVNFNINPDLDNRYLQALIQGYMALGGIQMQISCVSLETLQEAYKDPENYNNVIVRVGGYSEYFNRLPDDMKRMILNRTVHGEKEE